MICNKCGAQMPDGSQFCDQCGTPFAPAPQQAQPTQPMNQPAFQQPTYAQPQQPMQPMQQPMGGQQFAPPQQARVRTPLDPKKKQMIIIIGACAAVLVAFLIVLFAAIIPNSGAKGKLRHRWQYTDDHYGETVILDLKTNQMSEDNYVQAISSWKVQGNHLLMTATYNMNTSTVDFYFMLTPDGKYLLLFENSNYNPLLPATDTTENAIKMMNHYPDYVLARMD